jgi:hypothetical protein
MHDGAHRQNWEDEYMKSWSTALRDGVRSGSIASLTSTAALAACGECENGSVNAPTNAISHWLWGSRAEHEDGFSLRYTAVGFAIHHASSIWWAIFYERYFGRHAERCELAPASAGAALVAGLACTVDYTITPPRLRPGFEKRLSIASLALVYGAFAAGLVLHGALRRKLPRTSSPLRHPAA